MYVYVCVYVHVRTYGSLLAVGLYEVPFSLYYATGIIIAEIPDQNSGLCDATDTHCALGCKKY